jgi:hypothetical protein
MSNDLTRSTETINSFDSLTLEELDKVKLLNRVDSKYVIHIKDFPMILGEIKSDYKVLEIESKRIHRYESLYFDTVDFDLYKYHHNDKQDRFKVRYRKYLDTGLCYFEIKYKEKGNRTNKIRAKRIDISTTLSEADIKMIEHDLIKGEMLQEKVWVYFDRITIANNNFKERVTLDLNIRFDNKKIVKSFPELVVCEIKQEKSSYTSSVIKACTKRHYEQTGFSKYSTAIAMMEAVKNNNFKPNFIKINKLING